MYLYKLNNQNITCAAFVIYFFNMSKTENEFFQENDRKLDFTGCFHLLLNLKDRF